MTLLDLLAEAGGPTEKAYLEKITVLNMSTNDTESNVSKIFDLEKFVNNPIYSKLPVVRVGDTVYVPDLSQSNWQIFITGVKDILSIVSIVAITGGI